MTAFESQEDRIEWLEESQTVVWRLPRADLHAFMAAIGLLRSSPEVMEAGQLPDGENPVADLLDDVHEQLQSKRDFVKTGDVLIETARTAATGGGRFEKKEPRLKIDVTTSEGIRDDLAVVVAIARERGLPWEAIAEALEAEHAAVMEEVRK